MSDQRAVLDFRAVLAAVPLPCWLLDADLVVVAVSDALLALTGRSHDELVDRPVADSFPTNPAQPGVVGPGGPLTDSVARALHSGATTSIPRMRHDIELPAGSGRLRRALVGDDELAAGRRGRTRAGAEHGRGRDAMPCTTRSDAGSTSGARSS